MMWCLCVVCVLPKATNLALCLMKSFTVSCFGCVGECFDFIMFVDVVYRLLAWLLGRLI